MWKRRAKIVLLLAFVALLAVFIVLQTSAFQQWLLRKVEVLARDAGIPFSARHLSLNWRELQASLDGFVYDDGKGTRVTAERVSIDVPWDGFNGNVIVINELQANGVVIDIRSPEPVVPEPSGEPTKLPRIRFGRLAIDNTRLRYANQSTVVDIPAISIDVRNGNGSLRIQAPITIPPDTRLEIREIPLQMSDEALAFGPSSWGFAYTDLSARGTTRGNLRWFPTLALDLDYSTDPFAVQNFKNIESSGKVNFENGVLKITEFRAASGPGEVQGTAEISDKQKSTNLSWTSVGLDPAGFPAVMDGAIGLKWTASDFSDASGEGSVSVRSRQYGNVRSEIQIRNGRAMLDVVAAAFDATVRANVSTGLDQKLSGDFVATHRKYGVVTLQGSIGGTIKDPVSSARLTVRNLSYNGVGPVDASASASLKSMVVSVTDIQAMFKQSVVEQGSLRVNLNNNAISGEIPAATLQLADLAPDFKGSANLVARIDGTIQKPSAEISAMSAGIDVGGTHIDSVELNGELAGQELRLLNLTARQAEGLLQASGAANLSTEAIEAKINVTNLNINQVRNLSTTASLDADVRGTLRAPTADFTGKLTDVVYQGEPHGDIELEGKADGNAGTIRVHSQTYMATAEADVTLRAPYPFAARLTANNSPLHYQQYEAIADGTAELSGQLQPFKASDVGLDNFTLKGEGIDLSASGNLTAGTRVNIAADLAQLPIENVKLRGNARVVAVVRGTIEDPQIEGQLETSDATVQTAGMTEAAAIEAAVNFTRDEFLIQQMRATFAGASASISGAGTIKGTGKFQFQADNIRPEQILKDRPVSGLISLEGSVDVAGPNIDAISGQARVTQFQLSVRDIAIHQVEPIEVRVENQVLSVTNFTLEGLDTRASITGNANLRTRTLNFNIDGNTDIKLLEAVLPDSRALGQIRTSIAVRGTPEQPDLQGFMNLDGMQVQLYDPPVFLTGTSAEIRFDGDRLEIARAAGTINGGMFEATGGSGISSSGLRDAAIQLNLTKAQVEYPEGLQSEISSQLNLTGTSPNLDLSGNVDILGAIYSRDIDLTQEVFARITTANTSLPIGIAAPTETVSDQIRLDVTVGTPGLVSVVNNLASLDLNGTFRVRGTMDQPIILGRATALQGGELYFGPQVTTRTTNVNERRDRYVIEQGSVDFNNPLVTEPNFDFLATHEVQARTERYLVQLRVSGTPQNLKTDLTSDPARDEADIIAMLLTGRSFKELQGAQLTVAREQAFNYLSGQLGGLFQNAGSVLGLDTVRLEPIMLAESEDLSAKLTIGKDITEEFSLVYSQNLGGTRDQSWIASYETIKNLLIRGINEADQNRTRVELRQDLRWGGGPELPKRIKPLDEAVLGEVAFVGSTLPEKDLLKQVTKPGKPFNSYRMNQDIRKLQEFYAKQNFLHAKIRGERTPRDANVDVRYTVEEGPKIVISYEGSKVPRAINDEIRKIWTSSFSEAPALRESQTRLLRYFRDEGYLQAKVSYLDQSPSADDRRFVYHIEQGEEFDRPKWVFVGIEPMEVPESAGIVLENPMAFKDRIEYDLRRQGYLQATSTLPELQIEEGEASFQITVERGPLYSIGKIAFEGNQSLEQENLTATVNAVAAASNTFTSDWLSTARQRIISKYWENGFNDVQVIPATFSDQATTTVNVTFSITEGEQQVIKSIEITGNDVTKTEFVTRQFAFKEGDPVDYSRINLTRKKLYDTRLFKRTDITVVQDQGRFYNAEVKLNEQAPWRFRYGFAAANKRQTSDRDLGITADFSYGNLFGKGILLGTSGKATSGERDGRVYISFPTFLNRDVSTSATLFRTRDLTLDPSITDLWGVTIQQQWRLKNLYILSYDYSYKWNHSFDKTADPNDFFTSDITFPVARFNATLSRDSRNDILNATKGTFFSNSVEVAPPGVGSYLRFFKNYTQYFRFRPVKNRLVWASAVRMGVAKGFGGQDLVPDEQFTAGGPTTVRAFKAEKLTATSGDAVFILNQEIRSPLFWKFSGVAFLDAGNVYPGVNKLNPFKLRYSPGIGIRMETPFVLIRVDLGINTSPRTGEPRRMISFGIGQAF